MKYTGNNEEYQGNLLYIGDCWGVSVHKAAQLYAICFAVYTIRHYALASLLPDLILFYIFLVC